jgi:hypothetical protein
MGSCRTLYLKFAETGKTFGVPSVMGRTGKGIVVSDASMSKTVSVNVGWADRHVYIVVRLIFGMSESD